MPVKHRAWLAVPPARVRFHFGLTQANLADLLGISQVQVSQAEADTRPLPAAAHFRLHKLGPLLTVPPAVVPLDTAPLRRLDEYRYHTRNIGFRLRYELPDRAAVATHRFTASGTLPAALAAADVDAPLPPRRPAANVGLRDAALDELADRNGPAPLARLRVRLAGLRAEAAALQQALDEAGAPAEGHVLK